GYHRRSGSAHAEVIALHEAGARSLNGTLYVSLEPCSHHGKTPPCVDRIIAGGIRRVVVGTLDPDPRVSGRGVQILTDHGIQVDVGCLRDASILLNLSYFKRKLSLGSSITVKVAMTIDGKIASAPGKRDAITGSQAQQYVHKLRAMNDAVIIGIDTLLTDRPRLDCRSAPGLKPPAPVVLDSSLRFPEDYPWMHEGREFFVMCATDADDAKARRIEDSHGLVIRCSSSHGQLDLHDIINKLADLEKRRILIEGGGRVLSSVIRRSSWDALCVFISASLFGEDGVAVFPGQEAFKNSSAVPVDAQRIGDDFLLRYLNNATRIDLGERLSR
ncbi:MAG: bifunctional diaminohydroxyphosphoribosylaminopyrimidine deaminase/5-amino-6-(5-phosphoribosylamino)uracil reductase RibD, partial [Candidatus Latescibacterota bacterium]